MFKLHYFTEKIFGKDKKSDKAQRSIRFTDNTYVALEQYAKKNGVAVSVVVQEMVEYCLVELLLQEQITPPVEERETFDKLRSTIDPSIYLKKKAS